MKVSVGGDDQGAPSPLSPLPPTGGYRTEDCNSWLVGVEGGVEDGFCSGFDEVAALGQGLLHAGGNGAGGYGGNEPGDKTRGLSGPAGAGGSGGDLGKAVVNGGGDVVGVGESAILDEAWQEGADVVVIGFGAVIGGAVGAPIGLWLAHTVGVCGTAVACGMLAFGSALVTLSTQTAPGTFGGVTPSEDNESTKHGFQKRDDTSGAQRAPSCRYSVCFGADQPILQRSEPTQLATRPRDLRNSSLSCVQPPYRRIGHEPMSAISYRGPHARPARRCNCRIRLLRCAVAETCVQYRRWDHFRSHPDHCVHGPDERGRHHGGYL